MDTHQDGHFDGHFDVILRVFAQDAAKESTIWHTSGVCMHRNIYHSAEYRIEFFLVVSCA